LELCEPTSARVIALMREREKLLAKIARKKQGLDKQTAAINELQLHVARAQEGMRPLMEQGEKVDHEIHQLFAILLAKGRLKRKDQREVRDLYDELQLQGTLSPDAGGAGHEDDDDDDIFGPPDDPEPCSCGQCHPPPRSPDDAAAARRVSPKGASSLRDIFRRLAVAVHPDRSQTDEDRDRRTEAMKEVTRAYQDGDLARLLELEKAWLAAEAPATACEDETERRCASLERTNRELKKQLRELEAEIRVLKNSAPVLAADELGLGGKGGAARVDSMIAEVQEGITVLLKVRDFVRSFVDGKITLDEFLKGPDGGAGDNDDYGYDGEDDGDEDLGLEDLHALLSDMVRQVESKPRRRRGRRPSRR
jgi:hypothetical protein